MEVSAAQSPSAAGYNRMAIVSLICAIVAVASFFFAVMTAFTAVDQLM
jgi:hypothetical protein